jgi:hypothetical protein
MSERRDNAEQAAEAAAIRRRWITLGEVLAVVAVLISALTLWNSWRERSDTEAERAKAEQKQNVKAVSLLLTARADGVGDRLTLAPLGDDQTIQSQTIAFPAPLRVAPVDTAGNARIEAGWFDDALRKARHDAGLKDEAAGDERLPVAITSQFLVDGTIRSDTALYDIGYALEDRFLKPSAVKLRGLSLVSHVHAGTAQARLDALWKKRQPTISAGEKK